MALSSKLFWASLTDRYDALPPIQALRSRLLLKLSSRLLAIIFVGLSIGAKADAPVIVPVVKAVHPHDPKAFTQGLVFEGDRLFESTGLYGRSELRELDPVTFAVKRKKALPSHLFGEGLVVHDGIVLQLTWRAGLLLRYRLSDLSPLPALTYPGEGWGLTVHKKQLLKTNGSSELLFLNPASLRVERQITVRQGRRPVALLNELEWVNGLLWANIWGSPRIAVIDMDSGQVRAWIDLSALRDQQPKGASVTNGIAWKPGSDEVLVTGKLWSHLYAIEIPRIPSPGAAQ